MNIFQVNDEEKVILEILKSELFGAPVGIETGGIDWDNVFRESLSQLVLPLVFQKAMQLGLTDEHEDMRKWRSTAIAQIYRSELIIQNQNVLLPQFERKNIKYAVLKGTSASVNYPNPTLRIQSDIDILFREEDEEAVAEILAENGYVERDTYYRLHKVFDNHSLNIRIEPHNMLADIPDGESSNYIIRAASDAFENLKTARIENLTFYMLPDKYQALSLLMHMEKHMTHDGVKLRQLCDWAVFVGKMNAEKWHKDIQPTVQECGVYKFAQVVTKASILYLGLSPEHLVWCGDIDDELCSELMRLIFMYGRAGSPDIDFRMLNIITFSSNKLEKDKFFIITMIKSLNSIIERDFPRVSKTVILKPLFWLYVPLRYFILVKKKQRQELSFRQTIKLAKRKRKLYDSLDLFFFQDD